MESPIPRQPFYGETSQSANTPSVSHGPTSTALPLPDPATIQIDGQSRFVFGANYPWLEYGRDFGENKWGYVGVAQNKSQVDEHFKKLEEMGVQAVRWFVFADGRSAPEFHVDGTVSGLDSKVTADLNAALEVAQAHHMRLILVLLDFKWLDQQTIENGVTLGGHAAVITDPVKRESFFQNALLPLVEAYGHHPAILAWEVMNEPEWAIGDQGIQTKEAMERVSLADMQSFASAATILIHSKAIQPVTVGSASPRWWKYWEDSGVDWCQVHYYKENEQTTLDQLPYSSLGTSKPCLVGEFATNPQEADIDTSYQSVISGGYAGAFPWSMNSINDKHSDLLINTEKVTAWAQRLGHIIGLPPIQSAVLPTLEPTQTFTPVPTKTIPPDPNVTPDPSEYGFEMKDGEWQTQTFPDSLAVQSIKRVHRPEPVYQGQYALRFDVALKGGNKDDPLSKGEAWVDTVGFSPLDDSVGPYDMSNQAITCWIYVPSQAQLGRIKPWIAFQVFAKDAQDRSEYGTWTPIYREFMDKWMRISLKPRAFLPPNGYIDEKGFDPTQIKIIGVKVGAFTNEDGIGAYYEGPMYIDSCTWK
jgi:hypothetical protein